MHFIVLQIFMFRKDISEIPGELSAVEFAYKYLLEALEYFPGISRKRVYEVKVRIAHLLA